MLNFVFFVGLATKKSLPSFKEFCFINENILNKQFSVFIRKKYKTTDSLFNNQIEDIKLNQIV